MHSNGNATAAYLVDTANVIVKSWAGLTGGTGYSSHLEPGGTLVRSVNVSNSVFNGGGAFGRVQKVNYSGSITWDYSHSSTTYYTHHDHCVLLNGNVLLISYELKTQAQVTAAGGTITSLSATGMWPEKIIEVQTLTAVIVWLP